MVRHSDIAAGSAVARAREQGHLTEGSVFAANAFFPYIDAPAILAEAEVSAGIVPKGGNAQAEVSGFFKEKQIAVYLLPEQFRGFSGH